MSDEPFKVGDQVLVKSGSPLMTVEAVLENGVVNCVFYVGPVRHNQDHPSAVLERYVRTPDFVPMSFGGSADDY